MKNKNVTIMVTKGYHMDIEQLKLFISIVDAGSFTKAEKTNYISKQAMLKQINRLEEEIGCTLLERNHTGIVMSEPGQIFYRGALKIIHISNQLIEQCQKFQSSNIIRVGAVEHQALLNPVNEAFTKQYPNIRLERAIHPNHSGEYRVSHRIIDVGETFQVDQRQDNLEYSYTKLTEIPYSIAMDPSHPFANKKKISIKELSSQELIIFPKMIMHAYVEELKHAFQKHPERLLCSDDVDHQVDILFSCLNTQKVMLTANPFAFTLKEIKLVPLDTGWKREYGIIYKTPISDVVQKYIDLAIAIYNK